MATITEVKGKLQQLLPNIGNIAQYVMQEHDDAAFKLVQEQLMKGKDGNDDPLPPYRDPEYAAYKRTLNPLGVTDLKLTGSFHRSWIMQADETSFSLLNNDEKAGKLFRKYGTDVAKLAMESKQLFIVNSFRPHFIDFICRLTGLEHD